MDSSRSHHKRHRSVVVGFRVYVDDVNKFKISIPQDWSVGTGEPTGFKSVTAFFPSGDSSSNVSVPITGTGPEFTTLRSFGKVNAFAETLVNGLDRSWKKPPGLEAKLIDYKDANGFYYIEYSLQNPGESKRRISSVLGMASNGWYNRLYTVIGRYIYKRRRKPIIQRYRRRLLPSDSSKSIVTHDDGIALFNLKCPYLHCLRKGKAPRP